MIKLPASVSTPADLSSLLVELRDYAKWFSHNDIKRRAHARRVTPPPALSPIAHDLVREVSGKKLLSQAILDTLIRDLTTLQRTAPTIHITLAAPASTSAKQALAAACRQHIAEGALVTFAFNATLLGGMVIAYGSHVFDWSFRRRILANRQKFAEVLRSV